MFIVRADSGTPGEGAFRAEKATRFTAMSASRCVSIRRAF
jgi:hypothetical protein